MTQIKEANNQTINKMSKMEAELKDRNTLENELLEKRKMIDSLREPKLPITIVKENISISSKFGSEFEEHEHFIKQTIVEVLASS